MKVIHHKPKKTWSRKAKVSIDIATQIAALKKTLKLLQAMQ